MYNLSLQAVLLRVTLFFAQNAKGLVIAITPSYGDEFRVSHQKIAAVISSTNAVLIVARIVNGWFADRQIIPTFVQFAMLFVFSCIALSLIMHAEYITGSGPVTGITRMHSYALQG